MFRIQEKVAVFFSTTICLLRIFHGKLMNLRMIILHHLSGAARGNSNLPKNHYSLWWKTFWVEKLDHHQLIFQVIVPFRHYLPNCYAKSGIFKNEKYSIDFETAISNKECLKFLKRFFEMISKCVKCAQSQICHLFFCSIWLYFLFKTPKSLVLHGLLGLSSFQTS